MSTSTETATPRLAPLDAGTQGQTQAKTQAQIEALGLQEKVKELDEQGYTVLQDPVVHALTDRVQ
jgi:hypothetical protein